MMEAIAALVLIALVVMFVQWLWGLLKAVVSAIWLPVVVVVGVWIIWRLINLLMENYVSGRSTTYEEIKKLYTESNYLPKISNIDLTSNYIMLAPYESPEDSFFVNHRENIQSNMRILQENALRSEEIKKKIEEIVQKCVTHSTQVPFEKYIINLYARKIKFNLNSIPTTFNASVRFYREGQKEEVKKYSWDEICRYNSRYEEMSKNLESKKTAYLASEEEQRRQEEARKRQEEERKRTKEREEERRKEAIRQERSKLSASLRYDVLKRDNFRCTICGRSAADGVTLHVDHIKPVSKGGKTEMSNLRTLCDYCNLGKSDKYDPKGMN